MNWITPNYNTALTNQAVNFFAGFQPPLGDFREPSTITHHRVIGKGKQTVIAVLLSNGLTDAAYYAITSGEPISNPQMLTPVMSGEPLYGDGDGTVPYHGLLGHTAQVNGVYTDVRVYVIDGAEHVSMTQREDVLKLIKYLLDGVVASQPDVHQRVQNVPTDADLSDIISPNDLPEVTDPSQLH